MSVVRACIRGGLAVASVALLACSDQPVEISPNAPPVADAGAPDPGGDEESGASFPPSGRAFGFSGQVIGPLGEGLPARRMAADAIVAGANAVRVPLPWNEVFTERGRVDRTELDALRRFADDLESRDGRIVIVLGGTPEWASAAPGDPAAAPKAGAEVDEEFARFAGLVAETFPRALAIETWNEPNASFAWNPLDRGPERYVSLHRAAAAAVRAAAPDVEVLLGGLAGVPDETDKIMRTQRYLKRMYAAGLTPADYDGLAFHPYPGQDGGRMSPLGAGGNFARVMADFRAGYRWRDPKANVWITEVGVSTTGTAPVSPGRQATALPRLALRLLSLPEVAGVFIHTLYEPPTGGREDPERGFGVMTASGEPKPAFCVLRLLVTEPRRHSGCD